jgi:MoaA/NifB/PqqE/SkfB family radical SAM enzyme
VLFLPPPLPRRIQIEAVNRCNLSCGMCPRVEYARPDQNIPYDDFVEILDRIPAVPHAELIPFGWGEPLLHPRIWDLVRASADRGFATTLFTNGLLWTDEHVDQAIESGLSRVFFSLEQTDFRAPILFGHPNPGAVGHLQRLLERRPNPESLTVGIVGTVQAGCVNHAVDLVRLGHDLGVDLVSLGRLYREMNARLPELPREDEVYLMRELRRLRRTHPVRVDLFFSRKYTGWKRLAFTATRRILHRANTRCPRTFDYVYVTQSGDVTPCCLHPNLTLGNLFERGLGEIWRGDRFRNFRDHHREFCGDCDLYRTGPARRASAGE